MTNKIEVPRELLERAKDLLIGSEFEFPDTAERAEGVAEEFIALLAAPEAPRQDAIGTLKRIGQNIIFDVIGDPHIRDGMEVFTAPLSPDHSGGAGEVVLPEYMGVEEPFLSGPVCVNAQEIDYANGWNACIDKVKELNQ